MTLLACVIVTLTILGVAGSHVFFASSWWRRPLLWSDRWHLWSILSYWLACGLIMWAFVPPEWWLVMLLWGAVLWWAVKRLGGKGWPMWWTQVWRWWHG